MAAMDQNKLNNMCTKIDASSKEYEANVKQGVNDLVKEFNNYWVSNASHELASEISKCLGTLTEDIQRVFTEKNESISISVKNFNTAEQESISYTGFTFGKPDCTLTLNKTLPNGKVGVADGADINSINTPMQTMITKVSGVLDGIKDTVSKADAFDNEEQQALFSSINRIQTSFTNNMTQLKNSLAERMSSEISTRQSLDRINKENLSS